MTWLDWLLRHGSVATGSLIVAVFSFLVSAFSVGFARRATHAALRNAAAAEKQANSIRVQVDEARNAAFNSDLNSKKSLEWSRLTLLDNARSRVDHLAPKPVVAVDELPPPTMTRYAANVSDPDYVIQIPDVLDFWANRWDTIFFTVRGVLINDGSESIRVLPQGPIFIEGTTPLSVDVIRKPIRIHPNYHMYLIDPRGCALFEWKAGCTVDNWVDITNHKDFHIPVMTEFICFPGSYDDAVTRVKLSIGSKVLYPIYGQKDKWRVSAAGTVVYVESERRYQQDTNRLRADLTGEFWDGFSFHPREQ